MQFIIGNPGEDAIAPAYTTASAIRTNCTTSNLLVDSDNYYAFVSVRFPSVRKVLLILFTTHHDTSCSSSHNSSSPLRTTLQP